MMLSLGHEVFLYGAEKNDSTCTEFISCISKEEQEKYFGNVDWHKEFFPIQWDCNLPYWQTMNNNAIKEIGKRIQQKDFICLIGGNCQKPVADAFPNHMSVEYGIGYEGVFSKYRVFESYAWMHYVYGLTKQSNGGYYDRRIFNYFNPDDFPVNYNKENYFLFIGRMISRKGVHIAAEVCKKLGVKLILAGQGVKEYSNGHIVTDDMVLDGDIEYVGTVDVKQRGELMSKAKAVFVPTQYIGPFEGVHAESNFCGSPVICTDFGVFTETVVNGLNGYRTRTFGEMLQACKLVEKLDPKKIREYAINNFSMDVIKYQYQEYFNQLLDLWDEGWYSERPSELLV